MSLEKEVFTLVGTSFLFEPQREATGGVITSFAYNYP